MTRAKITFANEKPETLEELVKDLAESDAFYGRESLKPESPGISAINESEGPVVLKIALPTELYAEYKDLADSQQLTVADLVLSRLQRCKNHSSIRSLYFHTSHLKQLENLLQKRPIETSEQALALLASAFSVRVGDFPPVPITAQQTKRLAMGAYGGKDVYQHLCSIIQPAIARATGI